MKRIIDVLLSLNNLRKVAGFGIIKETICADLKFKIISKPPAGKVLVISPHQDDDILGLGGTLKIHSEQKDAIKVVYISDGSGGISKKNSKNKKLSYTRREEAINACKIIGISDCFFLNQKDGKFCKSKQTVDKLKNIIDNFKPDIIYTTSFLDTHPDHVESAKILACVLKKDKHFNGNIFSYEIWSPIFINCLFNIDKQINIKRKAIRAHKTQLESRDYEKAIISLNQYRAKMFDAGNYAEGFLVTNKKLFIQCDELLDKFKK